MKELFQKLSNFFSFGKEHRLANVDAPTPAPEQMPETQEAETAPPKTPEEGVKKAEAEGKKTSEKANTQLEEFKMEPVNVMEKAPKEGAEGRFAEKHPEVAGGLEAAKEITEGFTREKEAETVADTGEVEMKPVNVMEAPNEEEVHENLMAKAGMKEFFDALSGDQVAELFGGADKEGLAATFEPLEEEETKLAGGHARGVAPK